MNVTCPKCHMENAYHNGIDMECPDCDNKWSINESSNHEIESDSMFDDFAQYDSPFFSLEHGFLYDCKVEHEGGTEDMSIISLAFKKEKNVQFVMIDAKKLIETNSQFVKEIIAMDYEYIMNDGIQADYPFDFSALTILCTTIDSERLMDYDENVLFDFKKIKKI